MTSDTAPPAAPTHGIQPAPLVGRSAGIAVLVVLFASFMDLLDATIVTVAAPAIATDLHASAAQLQWIIGAYILALGSGLITGGRIGDDYGRRRVFLASLAAFAVASAGCALATGPDMLIGTRVLQGLAGGLMVPQVFGIIRYSLAPTGMAKAFGAYGAVQGLAAVAGPLLGGVPRRRRPVRVGLAEHLLGHLPIAVVALLLGSRVLPESTSGHRSALDVTGAAMSAGAVLLILLPLVQGRDWGWPWWGFTIIAAGVLALGGFLRYERALARRGGQPLLDPELLRVPSFTAGLAASLFLFGGIGAFFLTFSIYLQEGTGRSAAQTGLVFLPYAIGSILTSGLGVALAARAGRALLISGSLILATSQAVLWLAVRDGQDPGYWSLALALYIGGLGLGLAAPILVNVVLAGIPGRHAGAAGGVLTTVIQIGGATGIAALGTVFFTALDAGKAGPLGTYGDAFASVLLAEVALYGLAAALMLLLPKAAATHRQ